MRLVSLSTSFSLSGPPFEWQESNYLHGSGSKRRMTRAAILVTAILAILDLCFARTNIAVLYVAPLILLAQAGQLRHPWRSASLLVTLTFGIYLLKNFVNPYEADGSLFDYRAVNRAFVALMILTMYQNLQMWSRWREEQLDIELPEGFRDQEQEISGTMALLFTVPFVILIAVVDYLSPANLNFAILYPIPLFICGWTRSRPLLWSMLALLLMLTVVMFYFGGAPVGDDLGFALERNRILASGAMIAVTMILHQWMGREAAPHRSR